MTVLGLNGPLMVSEGEMEFRQKLKELLEQGSRRLSINLAGMPEMDSWRLGALVRLCTQGEKSRCTLRAADAEDNESRLSGGYFWD